MQPLLLRSELCRKTLSELEVKMVADHKRLLDFLKHLEREDNEKFLDFLEHLEQEGQT
jgi:hypothetical protein